MAPGILQPPVLPDGHHAEHGQEERAAAGQDVPHLRGHQEDKGGDDSASQGRRLHPRLVHGGQYDAGQVCGVKTNPCLPGSPVGRGDQLHRKLPSEGTLPGDARHLDQSRHPGRATGQIPPGRQQADVCCLCFRTNKRPGTFMNVLFTRLAREVEI